MPTIYRSPFLHQCIISLSSSLPIWTLLRPIQTVFIPIPKKGNTKECSNYHTVVFISHVSKAMLNILPARFQQYLN